MLLEERTSSDMFDMFTLIFVVLWVAAVYTYKQRHRKVAAGFKAVLITGCDHGFGYMLAKRLDGMSYKVFAGCLNVNGQGAKSLRSETSSKLEILQLDVTDEVEIEAARTTVAEMLMGHMLWAVVNNAGIGEHTWFEWTPRVNFKKVMDVNVMGVVNVTKTFLPLVRAAKGRIINMASMAGRTALPGFTAYSCSKFAVIGFSESLRQEMVAFGVKVITVEPSLYNTGISQVDAIFASNESLWAKAEPGIKRDYGENYFRATLVGWKRVLQFGSDNISQVVGCYVDAVTAKHPGNRYAPPLYIKLFNDAMNMTTSCLQDVIIRFVIGITIKPDMISQSVGRSLQSGRRRSCAN